MLVKVETHYVTLARIYFTHIILFCTQMETQMGVFDCAIEGHQKALTEALREKAELRLRCEHLEQCILELVTTAKAIDDSWVNAVNERMEVTNTHIACMCCEVR